MRTKYEGGCSTKQLTPLKSIRAKCLDCSAGQIKEVRECPFDSKSDQECPLYPLRMGRGSRATLKKIKAYCLWCCNGQRLEVRLCPVEKCALWVYRFGKRPKTSSVSLKTL
jgi:hypothetical protein